MKPNKLFALSLLSAALPAGGQAILDTEHVDIGVNYEDDGWDLHIHDETNDIEYEPGEAILRVNAGAETTVSADPLFSFLGTAGSPVWILPNTQTAGLLFLGFGAEELAAGIFASDSLSLRLHSVSGPGEFAVFDFNSLGEPQVVMNSRDGFSAADTFRPVPGGHSDLNWAFSQPGYYSVSFEASGTLADGGLFTSSGPVAYTFHVVPEPSTWALMAIGLGGVLLAARRRARG
jgi:surface-anchored protein